MSFFSTLSNGITGLGGGYAQLAGAWNSAEFVNGSEQAKADMQKNQVEKLKREVENQRINGIADSNAQAASAAAQVKIQY